jgi:hypothetical protein
MMLILQARSVPQAWGIADVVVDQKPRRDAEAVRVDRRPVVTTVPRPNPEQASASIRWGRD